MRNVDLRVLQDSISNYTLSNDELDILLEDLKASIIANGNLLMDANKEDVKISKKQIKIKKMLQIVDKYRDSDFLEKENSKVIVYKGDPYITLHVCLQAVTQKTKVILLHEAFMTGVNKILVSIIENVFSKKSIKNLIYEKNEYTVEDIKQLSEIIKDVVIIGDSSIYQVLEKEKIKAKFYSYNNIGLYCESEDLIKLQEAIYIYANENNYEIEILYEDSINNVIKKMNKDIYKNTAILLTKSTENKELFEKNIKNMDVYVNDNPFKEELGKIYNYLG